MWLTEKADLSSAYLLKTKEGKGRFVFETLRSTAERSQKALRQELERQGVRYRSFYIANKILVQNGTRNTLLNLAARSDVARITANHPYQLEKPRIDPRPEPGVLTVESNITFIRANEVWALGIDGQGTVLAGNDTGLDWDHPALINQYRGWNGTTADHNYNWWDATGTYPTAPGDGDNHGTHTTGTMVGSDGEANQIGVSPGSRTIHCKNLDDFGWGSDTTITECFEWDLAPWDLKGEDPRPDLAPDAINNSWGYFGGDYPAFEDEIAALEAAGIVVEVSAGNDGPDCQSLGSPGDYRQALTTGSVGHVSGSLPGTLSYFSSRGQSLLYPDEFIPDVTAPGENIRSSVSGGGYEGGWYGTSMAGPHVTGLVGLIWSANPGLRGFVPETMEMIKETAVPLADQTGSNCGGDYTTGPNNDWGYGTIDALAAVQQALLYGDSGTLAGTVSDAESQAPLVGATIQATFSPTLTRHTTSDAAGQYALQLFDGPHTVDVAQYGYMPAQIANVVIVSGATTTLDINLEPADSYTVSGYVTDGVTGWPLSAEIDIEGYPGQPVQNDPVTGYYNVSLAAGTGYTFTVRAEPDGYTPLSRSVGPLTGDESEDFGLVADPVACTAPGYTPTYQFFDDFEAGLGQWATTGLWHREAETDTCGAQVAPFPSTGHAAYYGHADSCTYANSSSFEGTLTLAAPLDLPASGPATLSFSSYEQTECGGDCTWDNRTIELSTDGGSSWTPLGEGDTEGVWYRKTFDLTPYQGQTVVPRFRFDSVDGGYDDYLGWLVDDVGIQTGCAPQPGSQVYGYVYDANTDLPLAGAAVTTEGIPAATTNDGGFYKLFVPVGTHTLTATVAGGYSPEARAVTVGQNDSIQQDFQLPAGLLVDLPASLDAILKFGESRTMAFSLTNDGGVATTFTWRENPGSFAPLNPPPDATNLHVAGQRYNRPEEKNPEAEPSHEAAAEPTDSNPDPFGYSYTDSNDGAGPSYDWIEIAPPAGGSGIEITQLTGVDDGYAWPVSLPFPFNFYGTDYTEIAIASNGTIYFENEYLGLDNSTIPSVNYYGVETFIAPFWDDLVIWPGAVYYQVIDSGLIIEFYQVRSYWTTGHGTWQVILYENGNILFQYQDVSFDDNFFDQGQSATVGIQGDAATGLQYSYDTSALSDELAICFAFPGQPADCPPPDVPWLTVEPETGTLAPGASQDITVTFDAGVPEITQPGSYTAALLVREETPYTVAPLAVTMTISPSGIILTPEADSKLGQPGAGVAYTLQVTNTLNLSDSYTLNVSDNTWPVLTPLGEGSTLAQVIIGPLAFGQSETIDLQVMIPADAAPGATDTATVTVTSQSYPSLSAAANLTTSVDPGTTTRPNPLFLPLIVK
ncbi:MAG: S8 family serine peptidase [Anaerolineales bacterium]|nr:S8 family serine peptidase [Anaerolineales bacterium]